MMHNIFEQDLFEGKFILSEVLKNAVASNASIMFKNCVFDKGFALGDLPTIPCDFGIHKCLVKGMVDFSSTRFETTFHIKDSFFLSKVCLSNCQFQGRATIEDNYFGGFLDFGDARFFDALEFGNNVLTRGIDLEDHEIRSKLAW